MKAVLAAVLIGYGDQYDTGKKRGRNSRSGSGELLAVEENEEKRPASPGMDD